jgi:hypothetical protein
MKNLQRMCAAVVLTCALAVAVNAGDMSAGFTNPPPPPPPQSSVEVQTTEGDIHFPKASEDTASEDTLTEIMLNLFFGVLTLL